MPRASSHACVRTCIDCLDAQDMQQSATQSVVVPIEQYIIVLLDIQLQHHVHKLRATCNIIGAMMAEHTQQIHPA